MPNQPAEVLERIAAVLRAHQPKNIADDKTRPGFRIWRNGCTGCGFIAEKGEAIDHRDHLSAVLVSELGLTEQWGWRLGDYEAKVYESRAAAQHRVDELDAMFKAAPHEKGFSALPRTVVSRYVTEWSDE